MCQLEKMFLQEATLNQRLNFKHQMNRVIIEYACK